MAPICTTKVVNGIRNRIQPRSFSNSVNSGVRSGRNAAVVHTTGGRIRNSTPAVPVDNWVKVHTGERPSMRRICTAMATIKGHINPAPAIITEVPRRICQVFCW